MPDLTIPQLAALDGRSYASEVKARLRDNEAWVALLDPVLVERTRYILNRLVDSVDAQKARVAVEGASDPNWLRNANRLRNYAKTRLDAMAPPEAPILSSSKETRAWRSFSAQLASALAAADPRALDTLKTPYGGMTAREWLTAREEKKEMAR